MRNAQFFFFWEMFPICYPWNDSSHSGSTNLWIAVFCTVAMKKIPNNINYRATYVTLLYLHQCLTIDNISTQNILYKKAHRTVKLIWSFHVFKTPMMTHVHQKKNISLVQDGLKRHIPCSLITLLKISQQLFNQLLFYIAYEINLKNLSSISSSQVSACWVVIQNKITSFINRLSKGWLPRVSKAFDACS